MSEIRDRDEFVLTVNRLMISAMEDIDCGRNEAGPTTLDLVKRIEDHDAALRSALAAAERDATHWRESSDDYRRLFMLSDRKLAAAESERDRLRERLDQFEAYGMPNVAAALDRIDAAEARLAALSHLGTGAGRRAG